MIIIEQVLARSISGTTAAKLLSADGDTVDVPAELVEMLIAVVDRHSRTFNRTIRCSGEARDRSPTIVRRLRRGG